MKVKWKLFQTFRGSNMNRKLSTYVPLLLATAGLCAGVNSSHKKNTKKTMEECAPLCYAGTVHECESPWEINAAATYQQFRAQGQETSLFTGDTSGLANGQTVPLPGAAYPINAIGVEPGEMFNWGFKVGANYRTWYDDWKVGVRYSYLNIVSDTPFETAYGQGFNPSQYANQAVDGQSILGGPSAPAGASSRSLFRNADGGTSTIYNDFNFILSRPTMIAKHLEITTFYGIDATFITRRQTTVFTNAIDAGYVATDGLFYQNYQKATWWGVGPMIGVHTNWYLAYGVSFYGDAYTSLEYGAAFSRTATESKSKNVSTTREATIQNTLYQFSPNYSFQLGLSWLKELEEFDVKIGFNIGYETTYYSQVIKSLVPEIIYRVQNGAGLGVQGLVLQGVVDF
ncbi:MAG: Lpg1974 family pore-forming outer membrane protein [Chlamydiia bacterium]